MLSNHASRVLHFGHRDGGETSDSFRGNRQTTTLRKDPTHAPKANAKRMKMRWESIYSLSLRERVGVRARISSGSRFNESLRTTSALTQPLPEGEEPKSDHPCHVFHRFFQIEIRHVQLRRHHVAIERLADRQHLLDF